MFGWLKKLVGGARASAAPPIPQGPLTQAQLRDALVRPCAPLVFHKPANIDPFATMFGMVRLELKGEVWPHHNGTPMWPLCQINLTQAPMVPDAVRDLSLISIFMVPDAEPEPHQVINMQKPDPSATWALRSYPALDGLTIPNAPQHNSSLTPRLGEWEAVRADYANHDLAGRFLDTQANDICAHDWFLPVAQTKLGGWPHMPQAEPWWERGAGKDTWDFVIQVEAESKPGWSGRGDGVVCIARSRKRPHLWAIDVQFVR